MVEECRILLEWPLTGFTCLNSPIILIFAYRFGHELSFSGSLEGQRIHETGKLVPFGHQSFYLNCVFLT